MRIGMRLLLGYFLLVAVAAWFVLAAARQSKRDTLTTNIGSRL